MGNTRLSGEIFPALICLDDVHYFFFFFFLSLGLMIQFCDESLPSLLSLNAADHTIVRYLYVPEFVILNTYFSPSPLQSNERALT